MYYIFNIDGLLFRLSFPVSVFLSFILELVIRQL